MRFIFVFLVCLSCASTTDLQPPPTSQESLTLKAASTPTSALSAPTTQPLAPVTSTAPATAATSKPSDAAATLPIAVVKPKKKLTPYQKCIKKRGAGASGGRCPCFCAEDGTVECSECITLPGDIR
jgi:hypothetical protein